MKWTLDKFCFFANLKTGSYVWGILSAICSIIVLIIIPLSTDTFMNSLHFEYPYPHDEKFYKANFYLVAVGAIANLFGSVCLAIGAEKENHYLVSVYLIIMFFILCPLLITAITVAVAFVFTYAPYFLWWCVFSYYYKLLNGSRENATSENQAITPEDPPTYFEPPPDYSTVANAPSPKT